MKIPEDPKPVEIPGRLFSALSVVLFVWHESTNKHVIDWMSLALFACIFLPWFGYFIEHIKILDFEAKFPPAEGQAPKEVGQKSEDNLPFAGLTRHGKKVLATLWRFQKDHGKDWGFIVPIQNPQYLAFQAGVAELIAEGLVQIAKNKLVVLTEKGIGFCNDSKGLVDRYGDIYTNFVPLNA